MTEELPEDNPDDALDVPAGEETEPGATSAPPEGVEIPIDTPYGSNRAIEPLPEAPPEAPHEDNHAPTDQPKTEPKGSIKISLPIFLLLALGLLVGTFIAGTKLAPKPNLTQTETQAKEKRSTRCNFVQDIGLYSREAIANCWDMLNTRLELANNQIIVVTSDPSNRSLLEELKRKKDQSGLPIFIFTGKDTPAREMEIGRQAGMTVYRLKTTLERPYTIVLIDKKIVMDISRENWIWETTEPDVIKATAEWIAKLSENLE